MGKEISKYKQLFELSPLGIALIELSTGKFIEVNKSFSDLMSYDEKELENLNFYDTFNISNEKFTTLEKSIQRKDGKKLFVRLSFIPIEEEEKKNFVWIRIENLTEQKEHEIIYNDNKTLLEFITLENSLEITLTKIVSLAQERSSGVKCSILLLDKNKKHLLSSTAPSLPQFYNDAINGIEIGDKIGSCGSAAYNKRRVIVENINTHENWQDYLALTKEANLHSCWSEPIFSSNNEILGTFAIYNTKPKKPSNFEIKLIESYANLAAKAIEKDIYNKELNQRTHELEQLFDNTYSGLMYISKDRVLIKANKRAAEIFDYKSADDMIGMSMEDFHLSKEKFIEFGKGNFTTLVNHENTNIEYQVKKKDGSPIWCNLAGKALDVNIPADLSKGVIWTVTDISLRKEYEEKLEHSELLNKNIISTIPQLLWLKDEKGLYIACNEEFEKFFGAKEKDIIGKTDYDFVDKELAEFFKMHDKKAMEREDTLLNEEWLTYAQTKERFLFETSKKAMKTKDGKTIGVLGLGHNITKRKQKEEELKELNIKTSEISNSQQALLSLFDKGDAVLIKWKNDKKRSIEYISLSVIKLFRYSREEFLSEEIDYGSCIHKSDLKNVKEEVAIALKNNLNYFKHIPYRIITKEGTEKWVLDNCVTLKNEKNEIVSFISYIIDITEQIKNQELIFHQSKIASMGEMLGNISHQWRQPLSAISTLATGTSLKKEIKILEDTEFYENMDLINKNAQYLSKTIDDFRNFFTSDINIKKETNLKNSFNSIYSLIKDSFKSSNIEIIFNLQDTNLIINESIFIQAMINILNNARDALTQNNNIDKYVFVDLLKNENEYLLTIKDNAGGIEENIKNKIFEPYFTTKHKSQGTGIGLYMTNQIITKQIQGEILVKNVNYIYENKEFYGASFEIRIPI